jgi:hypothetical protein
MLRGKKIPYRLNGRDNLMEVLLDTHNQAAIAHHAPQAEYHETELEPHDPGQPATQCLLVIGNSGSRLALPRVSTTPPRFGEVLKLVWPSGKRNRVKTGVILN